MIIRGRYIKLCLGTIILMMSNLANAQNLEAITWDLSLGAHYGVILKHRPQISHLTHQNIFGLEANLDRPYSRFKSNQRVGISILYLNYRNEHVGTEYGVVPYFRYRFSRTIDAGMFTRWVQSPFGIRLGAGVGYFTKTFDRADNYQNLVISSRLNAILQAKVFYEKGVYNIGFCFTHASNGAFKMPNLGINVVSLTGSYRFLQTKSIKKEFSNDSTFYKQPLGVIIETGVGMKEVLPTGGKKYVTNTLGVIGYKGISPTFNLIGGLMMVYNRGLIQEQIKENIIDGPSVLQIGAVVGTEIDVGKVVGTIHYGYNFFMPFEWEGRTYTMIGLKYEFTPTYFGGIRLKANGGKADFVELTFHYKI